MMGKALMEHYDLGDRIIMHNELQNALCKAKTNKAIRIDKIPNEIKILNHRYKNIIVSQKYCVISSLKWSTKLGN